MQNKFLLETVDNALMMNFSRTYADIVNITFTNWTVVYWLNTSRLLLINILVLKPSIGFIYCFWRSLEDFFTICFGPRSIMFTNCWYCWHCWSCWIFLILLMTTSWSFCCWRRLLDIVDIVDLADILYIVADLVYCLKKCFIVGSTVISLLEELL